MHEALDIRRNSRLPGSFASLIPFALLLVAVPAAGQTLQGSPASLDRQNAQARAHNFSYIETSAQVREFVANGHLVRVSPNSDFDLHLVSYPYARPAVKVFIERFAAQYRSACGEKLVVTSLTRPISEQPANASVRSVHPTGMAVDLRRSGSARCRNWLESTLLSLEAQGVLEVIFERNPPHYHLALYPDPYMDYLAKRGAPTSTGAVAVAARNEMPVPADGVHRVVRGETLSAIASRYGVSLAQLRAANGIQGDRILVGAELRIPGASVSVQAVAAASAPAVSTAVQANLPSSGAQRTHTIVRGESLWQIAQRYGVTEAAIRAANGISGNRILAGQKLHIPSGNATPSQAATAPASSSSGTTVQANLASSSPPLTRIHTVARGESLWQIARDYGVTEASIRSLNKLSGSTILAGQRLEIPTGVPSSPDVIHYTVKRGDSLWVIASRLGTTVEEIRASNGMDTTRIYAGQVLSVPLSR